MTSESTAELFRALAILTEPPEAGHAAVAESLGLPAAPTAADYTELFLLQLYPYASIYLGAEGMMGGEARDRVAGFWRALRLVPPPEPDHLGALLGLYASLLDAERSETDDARRLLRHSSRQALLWEHLLSWCPPYLAKVVSAPSPTYAAWASLLLEALIAEAELIGAQSALPVALQSAAALPSPSDPASDWITALLAPSRSGFIVSRADLARAASDTEVGLRIGERAFILRSLLEQDPAATALWLADEADRAASAHASMDPVLGDVRLFWIARAQTAAAAMRSNLPSV